MAQTTHPQPDTAFAERYDAVMVPVIFRPWAQELLRLVPPRAGAHALDLACGTGAVTRELAAAAPLADLTGVDHSEAMLAVARARAAEAGISARFIQADAACLPVADACFDLAYCQQALQFFPDRPAALRELRRVMAPGGRVAFCVSRGLEENPLLRAQARALERHVGLEAGAAVRAICALSDPQEIGALFEVAGFDGVVLRRVSLELHHPDGRAYAEGAMGGMHTGDKLGRLSEAARTQCIEDFLSGLGDGHDGTAIRFPHVSTVITATA